MNAPRDADAVNPPRFYVVVFLAAASYATFFLPRNHVSNDVSMVVSWVFALSWLLTPPAVYLDIQAVRSHDAGWTPKTAYWILGCLLPVVHMSTLVPYVLRRYEKAVRRESWGSWWRIAGLGASLPVLLVLADIVLLDYLTPGSETVETALTEVGSVAFVGVTVLVPVALKYDISYVRDRYEWRPDELWVLGAVPWFLNFLVIAAYNFKRNPDSPSSMIDEIESGDEHEPVGEISGGKTGSSDAGFMGGVRPEPRKDAVDRVDSVWWYLPLAAAVLAVIHVLAGVGLYLLYITGSLPSLYSWFLPYIGSLVITGLLAAASYVAIYFDAQEIKESEAEWQPLVIAYVFAGVLITPLLPPIIYVVQRHRHLGEP